MKHKGQNPKAHNRDPLPYKTLPSRFSLMSIVMNSWDRNSSSIACTFVDPVSYGNIRGGGWPYTASKGETFVDVCNEVLYEYSVRGTGSLPSKTPLPHPSVLA
ncbi:hypothetical protein CIPAW_09G146800 [Carya illinoinensis]|uniref:Uncharacterized protein n=1 Tax=Carya illinoinensis TaxID=32201 RepID=A0A8T1PKH4_CARIL|nr:hypothetical protein CIPAW_09G146800 [Carya illinoinensis]KAG6642529.1 hypothetical protein CIPAW_09G146800 [Carya illinoinensis]